MSKLFLYIVFCMAAFISTTAHAQKEYAHCDYGYFKNKKVSTTLCYDKDNRWGKAKAYNLKGELIYEKELRHIGGSSSVQFSYYDNGAVKVAKWHSAPDAGIQWYNTTTYFSPDGKIEREEENNYDYYTKVRTAPYKPSTQRYTPPRPKQEVAYCAAIYSTEFWYINKTSYPIEVQAIRKGKPSEITDKVISPGDTVKGGHFIMAEQFVDLADYYDFTASYMKKGGHNAHNLVFYQLPPCLFKKEVKRYYYVIR